MIILCFILLTILEINLIYCYLSIAVFLYFLRTKSTKSAFIAAIF